MLWFRRNFFWATFGLAGLVLILCGGFYLWSGLSGNASVDEEIAGTKRQLEGFLNARPTPSDTNIEQARKNLRELENVIAQEQKYFTEVPYAKVQGVDFVTLLNNKIFSLEKLAAEHNVKLPDENFAFGFEDKRNKAKFAPGTFPQLAEQLADVQLIVAELFKANIHELVGLRRSKTADDAASSPYCHQLPRTPRPQLGLVACPYELTFHAFSADLGHVLENLSNADAFLAAKVVALDHEKPKVQPSRQRPAAAIQPAGRAPQPIRRIRRPGVNTRGVRGANPRGTAPQRRFVPPPPPPPPPSGEAGVLTTVLDEELCRVVLLVEVIKPAPAPAPPPNRRPPPRGRRPNR